MNDENVFYDAYDEFKDFLLKYATWEYAMSFADEGIVFDYEEDEIIDMIIHKINRVKRESKYQKLFYFFWNRYIRNK